MLTAVDGRLADCAPRLKALGRAVKVSAWRVHCSDVILSDPGATFVFFCCFSSVPLTIGCTGAAMEALTSAARDLRESQLAELNEKVHS